MTYRLRISHDALCSPSRIYDLDDEHELESCLEFFEHALDIGTIVHLEEGESIVIQCIERDDQ